MDPPHDEPARVGGPVAEVTGGKLIARGQWFKQVSPFVVQ